MMLDVALRFACTLGWRVLPLYEPIAPGVCSCPRRAACGRDIGKHPRTTHGISDATRDERTIREWWRKAPKANIGVATDNLVVLDVDPRNGGDITFEALISKYGELPHTPTASTPGGGAHVLFAMADCTRLRAKLGVGIDVQRGPGLYIVAAPSLGANGKRYEWLVSPFECPLAALPASLAAPLGAATAGAPRRSSTTAGARRTGPDLSRSGHDFCVALRMINDGSSEAEIRAHLRANSSKYAWRLVERGEHGAEAYLATTVGNAVVCHKGSLRSVVVVRVHLETRIRLSSRPPLAVLKLTLATMDGQVLRVRATVVVPSAGYDDPPIRARYGAVASDLDPRELLRGNCAYARRLVGRVLHVAMRDGRIAWIRGFTKEDTHDE